MYCGLDSDDFMDYLLIRYTYLPPTKQSGDVFGIICLSVSLSLSVCNMITFESLDAETSFFGLQVHLQGIRVKFIYEGQGHQVMLKVTGASVFM